MAQGTKAELAQRAPVGNCPCCTYATPAAAATCEVGEFSNVEARGLELRKTLGPEAARRYAALSYPQTFGALSKAQDWAARFAHMAASPLFVKMSSPLHVNTPASPHPASRSYHWAPWRYSSGLSYTILSGANRAEFA